MPPPIMQPSRSFGTVVDEYTTVAAAAAAVAAAATTAATVTSAAVGSIRAVILLRESKRS